MGYIFLGWLVPTHREAFYYIPDEEGAYVGSSYSDLLQVEIEELKSGGVKVIIERRKNFFYYLIWSMLAILLGSFYYRAWQAHKKEEVEDPGFSPSSNHIPDEGPLYEKFLQEDANRRLVPKEVLKEEFQAWQENRSQAR